MEIISRQDAITRRLRKYFTGVPCKREHLAERYTQTANCIECLHPTFERASRANLVRFRMGLDRGDMETFITVVHTLSMLRDSLLQRDDVFISNAAPSRGGNMSLFSFRIFEEDRELFTSIGRDLNWARMSPERQAREIESEHLRVDTDKWVPPPLRAVSPAPR